MIIEVNNKQWTKIQLNAGFACLAPQTPCGFFLSRTDLGTDVNNLDTRLDVLSFSTSLAGNLKSSLDVWVLSTIDNALISYETDVVSGAKVIFISQGGGGGGQTGSYTFNSPLSEINGNVNLNFDTNGLKIQNDRLTLDLTNYQDFLDVQNEIANINTDINALEMQDNLFTQDINDLKTRVGSVTLQTTSQDLSGAVNELKAGIASNTLTFQGALQKVGNDVSIGLENDITLNATGDKLTLKLLSNSDFRNALLSIDEAKRIATFTDVGRVKPLQNHFTLNAMNGELGLDLSQTGVLTSTFVTNTNFQNLQTSVRTNTQNITRIDNEIADIDNTLNDLETNKANSSDVYSKSETYNQTQINTFLDDKVSNNDFNSLDQRVLSNTNNITQNTQDIQTINQNIQTLDNNNVKITNVNQDIDGIKTFLNEVKANNISVEDNGSGYGAVNINNQDGYFSITENGGQQALQLLAAMGFVDTTNTLRIRNLAGGLVTFNALAQYETDLTPTDDKDLVPLAYLKQVKEELLNLISSVQGFIHFVGVISNTSTEVTADPSLLTAFVQQEESRAPQNGDFVKTSDSYGFIFNGTNWINFGQVSISIATTTQAGIMMFGTNSGELENIGNGKAKVIGWDTVTNALRDLDTRITNNTNGLQTANNNIQTNTQEIATINQTLANKADSSDVILKDGVQTVTGIKTFSAGMVVNENLKFNSSSLILSPSTNVSSDIVLYNASIGSNCYANLDLANKSKIKNVPTPTDDGDVANKLYVDNKITSNTLTFQGALIKSGNTVSIGLENDIVLNATGDKLTLNLTSNSDFNALSTKVTENSRIATFSEVGRVKPLQNHFTLNSVNGELGLDLTPTGVLSANFATKASLQGLQTSISSNTQNIARIDREIADIDNAVNDLEANKANSNEVYLKTETYTQTEVNTLLANKADSSDLTPLETQIQTNTGNITQNQTDIQNTKQSVQTLDSEVVKLTNITQNIDGLKTFLKELVANNIKANDNGIGYGAVDIRSQDGYFSITEDGGASLVNLLATLGFVDSTTTFRIRNLAGGLITFNTLVQYETNQTPTNDNDLVPLSTLNQVKQELLNIINSLQSGAIHFVGVISNTSTEVTNNPTLLTDFVQQQESRTPKNGDFVKTSDSYGFIYNGTNWINFGQVSISIATTTSAGVVMLGNDEGELQDEGNGKVKVIGWDTVISRLNDLDRRITNNLQAIQTNAQNIQNNTQSIQTNTTALGTKANDNAVVKLSGNQTISGNKTFNNDVIVNGNLKAGTRMYFANNVPSIAPLTNETGTIYMANGLIGANCYYNLQFENKGKILGLKDGTADSDAANLRNIKNYALPIATTNATPTVQVTSSSQKYFTLDYVVTSSGFRNYSGIKLRAKQGTGSFVEMWTLRYQDTDNNGIFMNCIGNKLTFENTSKIINISCEDSDSDNTAVSKAYLNTKLTNLNQNFVDLTTQQIIGGEKDFTSELRALTMVANDNGSDYGAVDIRNANGYFSISDDNQGTSAVTLKAAMGFVDDATTFRIRNLNGGIVTFNSLAQYEGTYTPTDDKDLVHLAFVNQIKTELLNKINSIPAGLHFVGEIQHTSQEVTLDSDLLNQFIQTTESRQPRDGDFVRTSDSYGFIYSTTTWRNFGKISISIATTSNAGIVMLGSNPGELQDIGSGKVKVIGWDTVTNALSNLDNRTTSNSTNIALKANASDVYAKTDTYTKTEVNNLLLNKASTNDFNALETRVQNNEDAIQLKASQDDLNTANQNITNIEANIGTMGNLPYSQTTLVGGINSVKNASVLIDGNQTINGNKTFSNKLVLSNGLSFGSSSVNLTSNTDIRVTLSLTDSSVGSNCVSDIDCGGNGRILNIPVPTTNTEPITYRDIFKDSSFVPSASNVPVGGGVFVVR